MTLHSDLKRINTPLLLYMINMFEPDTLRILSPAQKLKEENTLRFLQNEMNNRELVDPETDLTPGKQRSLF